MEAKLFGTKGEVILHPTWHETEAYTRIIDAQETTETHLKEGLGYLHEIEEVADVMESSLIVGDLPPNTDEPDKDS